MSKTAILIPARYESKRFPGKSLQLLDEYSVIQSVYLKAKKVNCVEEVIVVTDNEQIKDNITQIGGKAILSTRTHINGTSRIAELAEELVDYKYIINLQGDEPLIVPRAIEKLVDFLKKSESEIATLKKLIIDQKEIDDLNTVKVVTDKEGRALYFSRSTIPFNRTGSKSQIYKHIGIYGFRRDILLAIVKLPPSSIELSEGLEQLRWLDNGYDINVLETEHDSISIDVSANLELARKLVDRIDA